VAICFVRAKVVSRGGGGSAAAAAAYRSGEKIRDEATGKTHDYTKKQGVDHSEILSPIAVADGKPFAATVGNEWLTDRSKLWNRVEASEKRYDAQLAREMIIAIPRELDREDQINLVREYVQTTFVDRGMIADINLHHLDGTNPHAHVMLTMRELKIDEQGIVSFGNKDRSWNDKKLLETQIKEWSDFANQYLDRAGFDNRIDSRSYEEQGISRIPQIHLGKNVTAMRRQGIPTERGDLYDQIDKANQDIRQNLEKIYQAEGAIRDLGKDETSSQQREVNDQPRPQSQEPSPDFGRTRSDLEDLARRPQRHDPIQTERRNQPGASSRPDREDRTDRNQPDRDFRTDSGNREAGDLHPEDTQNRLKPDLERTTPIEQTDSSNPDFAAIQAGLIELSNQTRSRRTDPERSSEGEHPPGVTRIQHTAERGNHNVLGSQRQRHPQAAGSTGTQVNPTISNSAARTGGTDPGRTQKEKAQKVDRIHQNIASQSPESKVTNQPTYHQEYQRVSAKIKRLVIEECRAEYGVETVGFDRSDLDFIDKFSRYMTEKNGYINPDRIDVIDKISDYQREHERRMFEAVAKNPLVIKLQDGLINLHFDVEKELKQAGYVENNDHEIDDGQIQGYVVNDDSEDEEIDEEIDEDKTPQYRVNVRVQNSSRDRGHGMSM
jgi:MobA/MobL family